MFRALCAVFCQPSIFIKTKKSDRDIYNGDYKYLPIGAVIEEFQGQTTTGERNIDTF